MAKIQIRANYKSGSKRGLISVSEISGQTPAEYKAVLFDDKKGVLATVTGLTISDLIAQSTKHGFTAHLWNIETAEV